MTPPLGDRLSPTGRAVTSRRPGRPVPTGWSRQKRIGVHAAIEWSPDRHATAAIRLDAMSGRRLLELRDRGEARPYVLGHAAHQLARDTITTVTRESQQVRAGLNRTELELLAWLAAVEIGFKMPGLSATHVGLAELLRVSPRTVGTHTRRLAAMGLIEIHVQQRPKDGHTCEGRYCRKGKHVRLWNLYTLGANVRELVAAERFAKRGGHRPLATRVSDAQRADLLRAMSKASGPLASLRSGKKIQGEESKLPIGSCKKVSPVGERVDRAPEGAVAGIGAHVALAATLAAHADEKRRYEQQLAVEFAQRDAAREASVPARVARAIARVESGEGGGTAELRELVRRKVATDVDDARRMVAMVDEHPIVVCAPSAARAGLCCPVHAVRAALRGGAA